MTTNFVDDNIALPADKVDASGGSSPVADPTRRWSPNDANRVFQALRDTTTVLRRSVSVRHFGAKGDGVTDDTAAIQAAVDYGAALGGGFALGARGFVVRIPASPTPYMFSNLVLPGYASLEGEHMSGTCLKRIPGSTGIAIRERTLTESPAGDGGSGTWIRNLKIDGNGTVGDGINIGNASGVQFNFLAGIENVAVFNFTSGFGVKLNANAISGRYIWCNNNATGFATTSSGGGCVWHSIWAEANSVNDLAIGSAGDSFHGVQTEPAAGTTASILVTGTDNTFFGVLIGMSAGNKNELIKNAVGANRNSYYGVAVFTNAHTFTHVILNEAWPVALSTGPANTRISAYIMGEGSGCAEWRVNQSSGAAITTVADLTTVGGTLRGTGARAAAPSTGAHLAGEYVINADPVAGGKAGWVCVTAGTPGTWKAFGAIDA